MSDNNIYGEGVYFERIRRITGYLVGDYRKMNDAKQSEVKEREKHYGNSKDYIMHNSGSDNNVCNRRVDKQVVVKYG